MVNAVIFDIDGTLVDSVDLHAHAWQQAFRHFGYDIPFDEIHQQIGKGSDKLIPHFLPAKEVRHIGSELDSYRGRIWKTKFLHKVKSLPNARELFQRIRQDGKRIALASSAKSNELETYKEIANIADLIDEETSADEVRSSKPDPDVIHVALAKLGNPDPAEVIMVGDTPYDVKAAKKAGISTIGLLSGGFSEDELLTEGCIAIYEGPADLLKHYDDSPLAGKEPKLRKESRRC